jgi:hypothetical protein
MLPKIERGLAVSFPGFPRGRPKGQDRMGDWKKHSLREDYLVEISAGSQWTFHSGPQTRA